METNEISVSVIVPVFQAANHIQSCILSLQDQTLKNIEMIFVDDYTPDHSCTIIQEAAKKDNRIKLLHNINHRGAGPCRNDGVIKANGQYVSFVDADDTIAPDFLERLYQKAIQEDLDVVKGCMSYPDNGEYIINPKMNTQIQEGLKKGKPLFSLFIDEATSAIYRRSFLRSYSLEFGDSALSEDTTFLLRTCLYEPSFGLEDQAHYIYHYHPEATLHTFNSSYLDEQIKALKTQCNELAAHAKKQEATTDYAIELFLYNLKVHAKAKSNPDTDRVADDFLEQLQTQVKLLPYISDMKEKSVQIKTLVEDGLNISILPFSKGRSPYGKEDFLYLIQQWIRYFDTNPYTLQTRGDLVHLMNEAFTFVFQMENIGYSHQEAILFEQQLHLKARAFPLFVRLAIQSQQSLARLRQQGH